MPSSAIDYIDSLKSLDDATDLNDAIFEMELKQGANKVYTAEAQINNNALKRTAAPAPRRISEALRRCRCPGGPAPRRAF